MSKHLEARNLCNLENGGVCSIISVMNQLKIAFKDNKALLELLLPSLRPDCLNMRLNLISAMKYGIIEETDETPNTAELRIDFSKFKILSGLKEHGMDPAELF